MSKLCTSCKKETENPKYCSTTCARKGRSVSHVEGWLRGEISGSDKAGKLLPSIREHLLNEADNKCSRCGWGKVNSALGRTILWIHRKDGNHKNVSCSNLVVLCGNCLSLTPSFGALNRGITDSPNSVNSRKKWD